MSKYITHFQTEAAYQTALPSLDLPNVSLVDELGEVHYHRALYGAHAGDIALYDVANAQKIVVTAADWNLTSYPTANYPIIGVVVADESVNGVILCSTHPLNTDGTPATTYNPYKWQNASEIDWGLTKYQSVDAAKADFNGKTNTYTIIAAIKAYDLANGTDNITGNIGQSIELFAPTGTVAGDWYIPAAGELNLLYNNFAIVNNSLNKIKTANSSLAVKIIEYNNYIWSSSEMNITKVYLEYLTNGTVSATFKNSANYICAFYKLA